MESESKRRSGSFGSRNAVQVASDDDRKLSLSEGSIVDKESNVSPESSEAGTLKKPRKFKPRKFLAKRFKSKKSSDKDSVDEQEQNATESGQSEQETTKKMSVAAKLSEKLSSPKLQRFNFVKRFSGKKSHKVGPKANSLDDADEESRTNLRKLESLSVSESSVLEDVKNAEIDDSKSEPSTEIVSFEKSENVNERISVNTLPSSKESVTLESKKVQLKITISGKKVERSGAALTIDKASPPTQTFGESSQTDIILPSTTTQVRLSTKRDQFYNARVPSSMPSEIAFMEHRIKPINDESAIQPPVTFAAVVKEGLTFKSAQSDSSKDVEKYLILTSSLNTIISAAKELDEIGERKELKFPELPELKIREGTSETDVTGDEASDDKKVAVNFVPNLVASSSTSLTKPSEGALKEPKEEKFTEAFKKSSKESFKEPIEEEEATILDTSESEHSDEMKKQSRKSRIPIDRRRQSASTDDKEMTPTVHTQEAHQPYHLNLTSSSSEESRNSPSVEMKADEIKFVVGTPVRPLRTSPAVSTTNLTQIALPESLIQQESIDESFHSPKSEKSLTTEATRRRIAYVPQLTIYTAEEQELLKSNFHANAVDSLDLSSLPPDSSVFPVFDDAAVRKVTVLSSFAHRRVLSLTYSPIIELKPYRRKCFQFPHARIFPLSCRCFSYS